MKASVKWIKEFVDFDLPVEELADRLSASGTKVEGIEQPGGTIEGVVVAEVLDISDHPNADKLTLVEVSTAPGSSQQVVCGVRNFAVGDRVPLAGVGALLPGLTIEAREIRGAVSNGMLCSGAELGVSRDHSGILVLPADAEPGSDVTAVLGLDDAILDLEVTPNRGDCMGMIGLAREVAALVGSDLKVPEVRVPPGDADADVWVRIEDPMGCPRYVARFVAGVKWGASPSWMQARLVRLGIRPVSVVVDITNYVMLETGQPLHAFDAATIPEHTIVVRRAQEEEEELRTLDGQTRALHPDDLVIADSTRPIALAGVMGGADTEVGEETDAVILEAANFDPATVAYTSRRHSLRSEASARFERGVDVEMPPMAASRAAALMAELAGGSVASEIVDDYPAPAEPRRVTLRPARTTAILGYELAMADQAAHLRSIQLDATAAGEVLTVGIPSWRRDLTREIDLIEEVARLAGFARLPSTLPPARAGGLDADQAAQRRVRRILAGFGLSEAWTSSFGSPRDLDALELPPDHPARSAVELENPTSELDPVLRTTLLPGLLRSTARNLAQHAPGVALFEVARTYEPSGRQLPREPLILGAVFTGERTSIWSEPKRWWDFWAAKGVLEALIESLGVERARFAPVKAMPWHPTRAAGVMLGDEGLGMIGELHPDVCTRFEVAEGTVGFEIALEPVIAALPDGVRIEELPRFPANYIDLAFVVDEGVPAARVAEIIERAGGPEVVSVKLFDVYQGGQIAAGKMSLAYALELRAPDRTLTDAEAQVVAERIVNALRERTGAELRS